MTPILQSPSMNIGMQTSKTPKLPKILLDTCVWIWIVTDDPKLSTSFKKLITQCHNSSLLFLSPISFWEVGMLVKKGRIPLNVDCFEWVKKATTGLRILPITQHIAIYSSNLPGELHGDPADRLIMSTASVRKIKLATADEKLLEYGSKNGVPCIDPR